MPRSITENCYHRQRIESQQQSTMMKNKTRKTQTIPIDQHDNTNHTNNKQNLQITKKQKKQKTCAQMVQQ